VNRVMVYVGWPVIALGIGILLAFWNTNASQERERTSTWIEDALRTSAMIIVVTGLGGALSYILRQTPAVDAIAGAVAATGLPAIFLPFVLGVVGNMVTGSTTVGVITAASVTAPMMGTLGLRPEATMLAGAAGSMIIKYPNSSYFWVCTSLSRMPLNAAMISYGGVTFIGGMVAMACVYVLWALGRI
jgi:gluconate:H+ symporter, GntP family